MTNRSTHTWVASGVALAVGTAVAFAWAQTVPATDQAAPASAPTTTQSTSRETRSPTTSTAASRGASNNNAADAARRAVVPVEDFNERYAVVAERNMFVRERVRRIPNDPNAPRAERAVAPPPPPETLYVLRGVVFDGEINRAYFQQVQTGEIAALTVGERLTRGVIASIGAESVEFQGEQGTVRVDVGENLSGASVAATTMPGATTMPAGGGGGSGAPPSSVEERMRQQRLQRSGGR